MVGKTLRQASANAVVEERSPSAPANSLSDIGWHPTKEIRRLVSWLGRQRLSARKGGM